MDPVLAPRNHLYQTHPTMDPSGPLSKPLLGMVASYPIGNIRPEVSMTALCAVALGPGSRHNLRGGRIRKKGMVFEKRGWVHSILNGF
jgi:hypothetical protein